MNSAAGSGARFRKSPRLIGIVATPAAQTDGSGQQVLTEAEDISDIAFGYMGSKALFAALHFGIFTELSTRPATVADLAQRIGLDEARCETLLTTLRVLKLVGSEDGSYVNSPAAEAFLVEGAKYDFSDYLRVQVGEQMYPLMDQIVPALEGTLPEEATGSYDDWFSDPAEAKVYSESQHAGSTGPARSLARRIDLGSARTLLDIGGGTGAFAITLCKAFPELRATVVDFPNVAALGRDYVEEAGLSQRIDYVDGNALTTDWPVGQDVLIMSYLLSGIPDIDLPTLFGRALEHLNPGGRLLIHDFIVDADRSGPKNTALWQLQHTAFTPKARSLSDDWLSQQLKAAGFANISVEPLIPGMTKLVSAVKPQS